MSQENLYRNSYFDIKHDAQSNARSARPDEGLKKIEKNDLEQITLTFSKMFGQTRDVKRRNII
ncbi:MAG: hypothetical protein RIQ89_802 [Bacteroidota bacterium]|jgi:hypothetical protein